MAHFSVVMPTHNRAHLLPRAITSVLNQTFDDFELVIVDDGSDDDTARVVANISDSRLRYVVQRNRGAAAARNHGARLASGTYLTFLDSDDEALPSWLNLLNLTFSEIGADIVCCGLEKVGGGREVEERGGVLLPTDMGPMFGNIIARFSNGGVFAMRSQIFGEVGGYTETLQSGQHTELAMRLLPAAERRGWRVETIMEALIRVHVHDGPRIRGNPHAIFAGSTQTLKRHEELFRKDPSKHARYHAIAAVNAARIGRFADARHHFRRSVVVHPLWLEGWGRAVCAHLPGFLRLRWGKPARTRQELDRHDPCPQRNFPRFLRRLAINTPDPKKHF